ncbi:MULTISPECIES: hypothetical protein [unclassified Paraburkholderia]|uniref:hypothetical protein n=1 Tax=unclassified Paraburkholderia TaxID=2615204 RepID=UPI002AB0EA17|nr:MULTISPECIES: hypothetical protein [unclassified Paraburkholderia]
MKIRLAFIAAILTVAAATAPGTAQSQSEPISQERAHQTMTNDANASAQANTDMSYGGMPDTRSATGSRRSKACWPRSDCDIYFGQ